MDAEPALPVPGPVGDHRVDESGYHDGVDDVGDEVAALGEGAGDEGGGRRGEHELEEPLGQLVHWKGREKKRRVRKEMAFSSINLGVSIHLTNQAMTFLH